MADWQTRKKTPGATPEYVWSKTKIKRALQEPIGAPIPELTQEEGMEIVLSAAGSRPDLPDGKEFVKKVRPSLGRSIAQRARRSRA